MQLQLAATLSQDAPDIMPGVVEAPGLKNSFNPRLPARVHVRYRAIDQRVTSNNQRLAAIAERERRMVKRQEKAKRDAATAKAAKAARASEADSTARSTASSSGVTSTRRRNASTQLASERAAHQAAMKAEAILEASVATLAQRVAICNAHANAAVELAREEPWTQDESDAAEALLQREQAELRKTAHEWQEASLVVLATEIELLLRKRDAYQSRSRQIEKAMKQALSRAPSAEELQENADHLTIMTKLASMSTQLKRLERRRKYAVDKEIAWPGLHFQRNAVSRPGTRIARAGRGQTRQRIA